jgi:hypothetical protein
VPDVEWLLRDASEQRLLRLNELAVIDDEQWHGTIERVYIGPSLRVFLIDVTARRDVRVEPDNHRTDQWMCGHVTIAGRADIDFLDGERTYATPEQAILFRLSGLHAAFAVKAGARFHSAGYVLDLAGIRRLLGGEVPDAMTPQFELQISISRVGATLRSAHAQRREQLVRTRPQWSVA